MTFILRLRRPDERACRVPASLLAVFDVCEESTPQLIVRVRERSVWVDFVAEQVEGGREP
jgi:hypothetical protein